MSSCAIDPSLAIADGCDACGLRALAARLAALSRIIQRFKLRHVTTRAPDVVLMICRLKVSFDIGPCHSLCVVLRSEPTTNLVRRRLRSAAAYVNSGLVSRARVSRRL